MVIQVYDVVADPGETKDRTEELPEKLGGLVGAWKSYAEEVGVVLVD